MIKILIKLSNGSMVPSLIFRGFNLSFFKDIQFALRPFKDIIFIQYNNASTIR